MADTEKYLYEESESLYHYRWNEEEAYKLLKSRIELDDLSSNTACGIKQDFHQKFFLMTLCTANAHPIEKLITAEYKGDENRKHDQKINPTNELSMTPDILIPVFVRKQYKKALKAFDEIVSEIREIIRPGRFVPRKRRTKKTYSTNYKRL